VIELTEHERLPRSRENPLGVVAGLVHPRQLLHYPVPTGLADLGDAPEASPDRASTRPFLASIASHGRSRLTLACVRLCPAATG
jgi:hypothetical protein